VTQGLSGRKKKVPSLQKSKVEEINRGDRADRQTRNSFPPSKMQLAKVLFILVAGAVASCEGADSSLRTSVNGALQAMSKEQFLAQFKQAAQCPEGCCGSDCACCTGDSGFFCSC
jgi:hypothetical protein